MKGGRFLSKKDSKLWRGGEERSTDGPEEEEEDERRERDDLDALFGFFVDSFCDQRGGRGGGEGGED